MLLRLKLDNLNIKFSQYKNIAVLFSSLMTIMTLIYLILQGIILGIELTGGIVIEIQSSDKNQEILDILTENGLKVRSTQSNNNFSIYFANTGQENKITEIKTLLEESLDDAIDYRKIDCIGPQVGKQQFAIGLKAILAAMIGIFLYLWLRFNWKFGLGSIIALIHDILLSLGFMSITLIELNIASISALLTIIGYSVNNSVVIYDRIREYTRINQDGNIDDQVVDTSINTTLTRTIFTSGTTVMSILPLSLMCTGPVRDFSLILIFGVLIGAYSSIFISTNVITHIL
ncbi:protein translocase subunit SecF [Wolbachia endosymbiont of Howardula sp.]|uniref:protein translocase subunit SecF n=1 Tax=Wolbachia endosymbiont of Howardula sp. TaxID=2916816 RepID=UPI00217D63F6|nr:protein translocase subunit SecF [Wolbachia endosymbiont of Howardula sp.]UWI82967.1 protein translocase subunit SecF [Wolbachia endosymbiont of Howardula sp.]